MKRSLTGFSLVEVITSLTIVVLISALVYPQLGLIKQRAKQSVKVTQLRQLSASLLHYIAEHEGNYPLYPYRTGSEWHNVILSGPINQAALQLANPDKAEIRTSNPASYHIGYSINECLMRSEAQEASFSEFNPLLILQATELKNQTGKQFYKTWQLGCHDKQFASEHNLIPVDGRFLSDIDNGGSLASRYDGSTKWFSYKLFEGRPCTCAFPGQWPETPFQTFPLRS